MVHSASEGLALAALLDMAGRRLAPWLVVACVSPAVGVLVATFGSLPGQVVPVLLGMVTGVLLRTAMVGLKLAAGRQENGRLSRGQLVIATTVAITMGVLLAMAPVAPSRSRRRRAGTRHGFRRCRHDRLSDPAGTRRGDPHRPSLAAPRPSSPNAHPQVVTSPTLELNHCKRSGGSAVSWALTDPWGEVL